MSDLPQRSAEGAATKIESAATGAARKSGGFGTFQGVFTPSVLTIFGVIMYLRLGWIVGHQGLYATLVIVTMACAITLLTGLSISATATNRQVKGGGAYFMISRSLGIEAGAAVGIPLFLAQALGISFYLTGFAESLHSFFPNVPISIIACIALVVLFFLAFKSADMALKTQYFILAAIALSVVSFFAGGVPEGGFPEPGALAGEVGFWIAFAVFFPAVTGIEAGISMSGDLRNPSRSLPLGTLAAVVLGYVVYMAIPIYLSWLVPAEVLKSNPMIMRDVAYFGELILVGIWGATLSSALGAMLGAPRTLQALARDNVFSKTFRFIGKGFGEDDSPRIATVVSLFVALAGILLGDLNAIAPILSMFFLTSYGVLNFSAGIEGMIGNPSWRPKFKTPWTLSIMGSFLCFATMFMIDPGATITALIFSAAVYYIMQRKNLKTDFGDIRRGILTALARYSIFKLAEIPLNVTSWRPHLLVLSGSPTSRWYLIELGHSITHGKGFMTIATILPRKSAAEDRILDLQKSITDYLRKKSINALVNVSVADDVNEGILALVRTYGLGPLTPNTVILGETEKLENFESFAEMIIRIYQSKTNILIIRESGTQNEAENTSQIDVWWGRERQNAGLSLVLGYMLQKSDKWEGSELLLKSIITAPDEEDRTRRYLQDYLIKGRLDAKAEVFVAEGNRDAVFERIRQESASAGLVFIGMKPPLLDLFRKNREEYVKEYAAYYRDLLRMTQHFPTTAFVLTAQDIKFNEIFE